MMLKFPGSSLFALTAKSYCGLQQSEKKYTMEELSLNLLGSFQLKELQGNLKTQ